MLGARRGSHNKSPPANFSETCPGCDLSNAESPSAGNQALASPIYLVAFAPYDWASLQYMCRLDTAPEAGVAAVAQEQHRTLNTMWTLLCKTQTQSTAATMKAMEQLLDAYLQQVILQTTACKPVEAGVDYRREAGTTSSLCQRILHLQVALNASELISSMADGSHNHMKVMLNE